MSALIRFLDGLFGHRSLAVRSLRRGVPLFAALRRHKLAAVVPTRGVLSGRSSR